NTVAATRNKRTGSINYIFCSDSKILEVNQQFLQHDYFTDIITFDYSCGNTLNGDIYISIDTVKSNAEMLKQNPKTEMLRVIVHGLLHLTGQGDKTPAAEAQMHQLEDEALELWNREI
ncbi:MAG: rRNA maturation RNase YbeY, partial [Paludibacter sp.]|nr:rRNA maturation RNase YbeY [Paludibacter sp.]